MGVSYPEEPWDLHGQALATSFLVPAERVGTPPPGTRIVKIGRRALVTTAFFRYEEPSPLQYDEIMATVLVRQGLRPRVWITHIWVDSPASRDGGRELWAIPKDLAEFGLVPPTSYVADGIGSATLRSVRALPGRIPLGFRIAQERDGAALVTPVRGRVRLASARARWSFTGPLAHLEGGRQLFTLLIPRFNLVFGRR
ncbi:hypothetical protein ASD11_05945 [Aeromicrobium sp. Root495]|uniref:acetoacetate decarboxylase family protein n=1 Tax=Aeromicrobium sp. Root495 TaxID=1736550 RepID=UPI0006FF5133|nr:acetoacetate decarboxylase family protein [Aeromicrobium sp. Root495]KQY59133.1 hypothetical protein ASD11_05945 [Aeromicrobium sp. Root495]